MLVDFYFFLKLSIALKSGDIYQIDNHFLYTNSWFNEIPLE